MTNNLLFSLVEFSDGLVKTLDSTLGIWYLIILNAFGVIAICCKVVEYQSKKRVFAFTLAMTSQMLWVAYFVFSGDFLSAISCIITFSSVLIFTKRDKYKWAKSVWWLIGFLAIQLLLSVFTFKSWKDLFALCAGLSGVMAYYCVDMKKYRAISLFYALFWMLNSIFKMYMLAFISDAASLISVAIGIIRYDIMKRNEKPTIENVLDDDQDIKTTN